VELATIGPAQLHLTAVGQAHHPGNGTVGQGQRRGVLLAVAADGAAFVNPQLGVKPAGLAKRRAVSVGEQRKIAELKIKRLTPGQFEPERLAPVERRSQRQWHRLIRRRQA